MVGADPLYPSIPAYVLPTLFTQSTLLGQSLVAGATDMPFGMSPLVGGLMGRFFSSQLLLQAEFTLAIAIYAVKRQTQCSHSLWGSNGGR